MASDPEKCNFLVEHLSYELLMLRFTHGELSKSQDQLVWNAMYESFAVHARILRTFLASGGGNTNMNASDYIEGFKASVPAPEVDSQRKSLDPQIFHLGKIRKEADRKPHLDKLSKLFAWLEENTARFGDELPDPFRKYWQPEKADPSYFGCAPKGQIAQSSLPAQSSSLPQSMSLKITPPGRSD